MSRWENGEALPEVGNLAALSRVFGVTVDWLLSEESAFPRSVARTYENVKGKNIGKILKKWCWLAGVFLALRGLWSVAVGWMTRSLVKGIGGKAGVQVTVSGVLVNRGALYEAFGGGADPVASAVNGMILWGLLEIAAGLLLAWWLKRWGSKTEEE